MKKVVFAILMICVCSNTWAGSKALMTVIGAGAGFGVGMLVGFSKYDEAINSEQKIWTSSFVGAAAGGIGGYFIGRHMDRKKESSANLPPVMQPIKFDFAKRESPLPIPASWRERLMFEMAVQESNLQPPD